MNHTKSELNKITTYKERIYYLLFTGFYFILMYGSFNYYSSNIDIIFPFYFSWEENIPFIDLFIYPYMSIEVIFAITFLLPHTKRTLRLLTLRSIFIISIACICFFLFPLKYGFTKPVPENGLFLFELLKLDLSYNQLPSLHIAFLIVLWFSLKEFLSVKYLVFIFIWFSFIALSTLFVYQHHFIDLPTGLLLGLSSIYFIDLKNKLIKKYSTTRNMRMAFYYLISCYILVLMLFFINSTLINLFLIWILLVFLNISLIYVFGLKYLIIDKEDSIVKQLYFFPYYFLNYLSWFILKRKLDLYVKVKENIYLGRYPNEKEYNYLQDKLNINYFIDLTSEQQLISFNNKSKNYPLLDQTIHRNEYLHKIIKEIEKNKDNGVFIHCSLGLSRSIIVVGCWLIYNGYNIDKILDLFNKIRPYHIKTKYIKENLKEYETFLKNR